MVTELNDWRHEVKIIITFEEEPVVSKRELREYFFDIDMSKKFRSGEVLDFKSCTDHIYNYKYEGCASDKIYFKAI